MLIISVDNHVIDSKGNKRTTCLFRREVVSHQSLSVELENIVRVLHSLFNGVNHEISITYKF